MAVCVEAVWGELSGEEVSGSGFFLVGNCPGGSCPEGNCSCGGVFRGRTVPAYCPGGNLPRTEDGPFRPSNRQ